MLALTATPVAGWGYLFLAGALALLRVLVVFYPSDVLAGYAIGILMESLLCFRKFGVFFERKAFVEKGKAPLGHLSFCSKKFEDWQLRTVPPLDISLV